MRTLLEVSFDHQGKEFMEGWQDCYTLVQQLFKDYCGLELKDYSRPVRWYLHPEFKFMEKLYTVEGFKFVGDNPNSVMVGDVLLMKMGRTATPNHTAIYVGGNKILHHLTGMKSILVEYDPTWRLRVSHVLKHPTVTRHIESRPSPTLNELPQAVKAKLAGGSSVGL